MKNMILSVELLIAVVVAMMLLVSGCAQKSVDDDASSVQNLTQEVQVEADSDSAVEQQEVEIVEGGSSTASIIISNLRFNPLTITVDKGTTVIWVNQDVEKHTVTSEGNFDSGVLVTGAEFAHTFDKEGVFEFNCELNPEMQGAVIVE